MNRKRKRKKADAPIVIAVGRRVGVRVDGISITRITAIMMTIVIADDFAACSLLSLVLMLMLSFPGRRRKQGMGMGLHRGTTVIVIVVIARSGLCDRRILL